MEFLWEGLLSITWQQAVMYVVGIVLIYLAIKKDYEPALLLPMGFGAILVNLPLSGVINQQMEGIGVVNGIIEWLYNVRHRGVRGAADSAVYRYRSDD